MCVCVCVLGGGGGSNNSEPKWLSEFVEYLYLCYVVHLSTKLEIQGGDLLI